MADQFGYNDPNQFNCNGPDQFNCNRADQFNYNGPAEFVGHWAGRAVGAVIGGNAAGRAGAVLAGGAGGEIGRKIGQGYDYVVEQTGKNVKKDYDDLISKGWSKESAIKFALELNGLGDD